MNMLTRNRVYEIEDLASELILQSYGEDLEIIPPIDVLKIARSSGLELYYANFADKDIEGLFDRAERKISVKEGSPVNRMNFTIAHELGHYVLHQNKPNDIFYRNNSLESDQKEEKEANCFAAALLMPRKFVEIFWGAFRDVDDIAKRFCVSRAAAYYRLKNLRLIN